MYKSVKKIHLWFSVPLGLIMSTICLTGLIMLFEPAHEHGGERPDFFLDVMRLHRWLFDAPAVKGSMTAGKMIVAIATCCMIVAVITGVILWIKRCRGGIAKNLKVPVDKGFSKFITTLHTSGGIYFAIFLLVMAFTGLTWSFGWYRAFFNNLFAIEKGSHVIYAIHTGAFGGLFTKIIWGISVLAGFTLPLTGYYLWLKRKK